MSDLTQKERAIPVSLVGIGDTGDSTEWAEIIPASFGRRRLCVEAVTKSEGAQSTRLGTTFSCVLGNVALPSKTAYSPVGVIDNPAGSGKQFVIHRVIWNNLIKTSNINYETVGCTFSGGTSVTPVNNLIGSGITSSAVVRAPAFTTFTTTNVLREVGSSGGDPAYDDSVAETLVIPPGFRVGLQALPDQLNGSVSITIVWHEEAYAP